MSSFQDTLDREVLEFDTKLDRVIGYELKKSKLTLSLAESLTGGLISQRLTGVPGSHLFYSAGVICYTPLSKIQFCGVAPQTLQNAGEVSRDVAVEMAQGLKQKTKSDLVISNTGIAGPANERYGDAVTGQAYIAFLFKDESKVQHFKFYGARPIIQLKAAQTALMILKHWLLSQKGIQN